MIRGVEALHSGCATGLQPSSQASAQADTKPLPRVCLNWSQGGVRAVSYPWFYCAVAML